eukprot:8474233-Pyramimonas_sp.AAC.1
MWPRTPCHEPFFSARDWNHARIGALAKSMSSLTLASLEGPPFQFPPPVEASSRRIGDAWDQ